MASLIRSRNWANTDLGPISTWSSTLLTTVNMMLAIPTPVQLIWGEQMSVLYNDAFIRMLQRKHPYALGRSAREVWAEVWPEVGQQLESVYQDGCCYDYRDLPLELLSNDKLERGYFTFSYSPIREGSGKIVGLLNLTQDVTEMVHAREAIQRSERRFRTLVNSASVGIAIGTLAGELSYMNPALLAMLGYTEQEMLDGKLHWNRMTPERFAEADRHAIAQLQKRGMAEPYEKAYFNKEGVPVPLLIGAFMLPKEADAEGDPDVAVFAVDLRHQKRTEGMLLQSEKLAAVGKLASSISHEINNPLEAVTNLLYLIRLDENLSPQSRNYLETADHELARVSQVASQTLRFHRQSTLPMRVDPQMLLEEVLLLYKARFTNRKVRVEREYQPDVNLTCYEGDIRQVLNNLVCNATDAMRSTGGSLIVRTRRATDGVTGEAGVMITVADTGDGMDRATLDHIFDAFYTTKGIHGTGLGLWISSRIVHKHRGSLRAHSSSDPAHHGTVFQLWLPVQLASTAQESWHEEEVTAAPPDADGTANHLQE